VVLCQKLFSILQEYATGRARCHQPGRSALYKEFYKTCYSEKIMVKKSKPSVKEESIALVKEETIAVKEEAAASGKDDQGIDFFYILAGGGVLIGILMFIFLIFRYVLQVI
jgi:hypothetical protein